MKKVIVGSEIESNIEILNLQDIWEDNEYLEDVKELLKTKGCKFAVIEWEPWCLEAHARDTLEKINEVIEWAEDYDIYKVSNVQDEDWSFLVAVPRDCVVILGEDMNKVRPKGLSNAKKTVFEYLEDITEDTRIAKESETIFQDISERVDKLREFLTGDEITLFLGKMMRKSEDEEN